MIGVRYFIIAAVVGGLCVLAARPDPVLAVATITVDSTLDTNASDSVLTLREAILLGNGGTGGNGTTNGLGRVLHVDEADNVVGTPGAASADTVSFSDPPFTASVGVIGVSVVLPSLSGGNDVIDGGGRVRIDGANEPSLFNCLNLDSNGNVVRGLQVTDCSIGILIVAGRTGNTVGPGNNAYDNNNGISVVGNGNAIKGNYIGTTSDGTDIHPEGGNAVSGVSIAGASNVIGGSAAADRNIISGNGIGVRLNANARLTSVKGNYIGTDVTGALDKGNLGEGVLVADDTNFVGGTAVADRNVISGNDFDGISLINAGTTDTMIQGNLIGTNAAGTGAIANSRYGVYIQMGSNNHVGGTALGAGNVIAFNGADGVRLGLDAGTGSIRRNMIHSNTGLGIDLEPEGVTANDAGDGDTGPNNLQNFPVLTAVSSYGGSTAISFTFNSSASAAFTVDFFSSPTCDGSGQGEGQNYIGSSTVNTDAGGNAKTSVDFPIMTGDAITATTTDASGNTSEFSNCVRDSDMDGWGDAAEAVIGTDPLDACPDDSADDAWPADINNSGFSDISDIIFLTGNFGGAVPPTPARYDVAPQPADGFVDITDVVRLTALFGVGCGP